MNCLNLSDNLMAIRKSNNFGDQIILIVDISKDATEAQRAAHPFVAGLVINVITNQEGSHIPFTVEAINAAA